MYASKILSLLLFLALSVALAAAVGCSDDDDITSPPADDTLTFGPIDDLHANRVDGTAAEFLWSSPWLEGDQGAASPKSYELLFKVHDGTDSNGSLRTVIHDCEMSPQRSGCRERYVLCHLDYGTQYEISVRAIAEDGSVAPASNTIEIRTRQEVITKSPKETPTHSK